MAIRRIVDLSHGIDANTPVYPGDPQPSLTPAATIAEDGFNVLHVRMGSQTGTHVDAPYHFLADGARIDELDLTLCGGPAVVADLRGRPPRTPIEWADLEPDAGRLGPGRILILHTGWSQHWGSNTYFDHPYLSADAAERVIAAGVRAIGLDTLNLDETVLDGPHPSDFAAHHVVLGAGGVIVENLTNLEAVDWDEPLVSVLPLRLVGADGAPVRAVALQL
jgi:kynurenine formamidase